MADSTKNDINITGMIKAERKSCPSILVPVKEALHNSLEVIRLARNQDLSITAEIELRFYIRNDLLDSFEVFDTATGLTGIKNMGSKNIYILYHHEGGSNGFSEYGIGSKLENLRCCNMIEHHTITSDGIYEQTKWNIQTSIDENKLLEVIQYERNPKYRHKRCNIPSGETGTLLVCSEILPHLRNITASDYIKDKLYEELCNHLIKYDDENVTITFKVYDDDFVNPNIDKIIRPNYFLGGYIKTYCILCCQKRNNPHEKQSFIIIEKDRPADNFDKDSFDDQSIKLLEDFGLFEECFTYYIPNKKKEDKPKRDKFASKKDPHTKSIQKISEDYEVVSKIKLILSTAERMRETESNNYKDIDKTGFYGIREVEGGNVVCTTIVPIQLKWNIFKSHRTRYVQFRGGIHYSNKSDELIMSDKSKSLSDDRDFEPSLRCNILHLTNKYFSAMREKYSMYNTDVIQGPIPTKIEVEEIVMQDVEAKDSDEVEEIVMQDVEAKDSDEVEEIVMQDVESKDSDEVEATVTQEIRADGIDEVEAIVMKDVESKDSDEVEANEIDEVESKDSDEVEANEIDEVEANEIDEVEAIVKETDNKIVGPTTFQITTHSRTLVKLKEATDALTLIYKKSSEPSLEQEILTLFNNIACNIIGKGGDKNTLEFIRGIPLDYLYEKIKKIWEEEYTTTDAVKMGSDVVSFQKKYIK